MNTEEQKPNGTATHEYRDVHIDAFGGLRLKTLTVMAGARLRFADGAGFIEPVPLENQMVVAWLYEGSDTEVAHVVLDRDIDDLQKPHCVPLVRLNSQPAERPPLVQIASDIMGACMNGDLSDKWEDVADCLVKNDFDGLEKLVNRAPMSVADHDASFKDALGGTTGLGFMETARHIHAVAIKNCEKHHGVTK